MTTDSPKMAAMRARLNASAAEQSARREAAKTAIMTDPRFAGFRDAIFCGRMSWPKALELYFERQNGEGAA